MGKINSSTIIVFDGDALPSKKGTEDGRRERRKTAKAEGLELLKNGDEVYNIYLYYYAVIFDIYLIVLFPTISLR